MLTNTKEKNTHNIANYITIIRIIGTICLLFLIPLSVAFFVVYTISGLTDAVDGWIARKTGTTSEFGAKLDSIADIVFYAVMMVKIIPVLWIVLPTVIWYVVAAIFLVRLIAYAIAALKYGRFASLHTYMNKLTGGMFFLIPYLVNTKYFEVYGWGICIVAAIASLEEMFIHLSAKKYNANKKSILPTHLGYDKI